MAEPTIHHVSDTAIWVAHYRALESERPDALFQDPFAKVLAGSRGSEIAKDMGTMSRFTSWTLAIRTHIIDRMIHQLLDEGVDTVLNLGCGLDARPYRMDLPSSLHWIEVDYPQIIQHKEKALADEKPRCQLERITLDLADRQRRQALFAKVASQSKKTLVLTEGVIPYLTPEQVGALADDIHSQQAFEFWITEYLAYQVYKYFWNKKRAKKMRNAPFLFFPKDWFGFFKEHGWVVREVKYLMEESIRLKRRVPMPWWWSVLRLITPRKKLEASTRYSGYVIFRHA
jgi:methyltransferase (TIGR00027 family)